MAGAEASPGAEAEAEAEPEAAPYDLAADAKALGRRVRAEMHAVVKALSRGDLEEALASLRDDPDDPWTEERLEQALEPCLAELGSIAFGPDARVVHLTRLKSNGERCFVVQQTLVGPEGDSPWMLEGEIDLRAPDASDLPLVALRRIAM
jgi:hypothetical protein